MSEPELTITEAALRLEEVVDRARRLHESTLLTVNGEPVARIVPLTPSHPAADDLARWFAARPKLGVEEAELLEGDIAEFRRQFNKPPVSPWD